MFNKTPVQIIKKKRNKYEMGIPELKEKKAKKGTASLEEAGSSGDEMEDNAMLESQITPAGEKKAKYEGI